MKKTLAQAKRDFVVGKRIEIIENNFKPERVGLVGVIEVVQTNAFAYRLDIMSDKLVWHWWGKADEMVYEDDILQVLNKYDDYKVGYAYKLSN